MRAVNRFLCTRGEICVNADQPVAVYYRMKKDSQVYHSTGYRRVTARNSFTVSFADESSRGHETLGHIMSYVKHRNQDIAVIRVLERSAMHALTPMMPDDDEVTEMLSEKFQDQGIFARQLKSATRVTSSNHLVAVNTHSIRRKYVFLQVGSDSYVSHIPNFIECD